MRLKSRLLFLIYCFLTTLIAPLGLLFLCYKKRKDPPYGKRVCELLGHYSFTLPHCIWFHTVSVGEAIAARPLIQAFVRKHPKLTVVVTTTTTTGAREIAKIQGAQHVFAPLDCPFAVNSFIKNFNPSNLFIMETELWPCCLNLAYKKGIKISIFNARMPEKTCDKYCKHLTVVQDLIARPLHMVICQYKEDASRFARIGVPEDKIKVAGTLKYDLQPNESLFRASRKIRNQWLAPCQVIGAISTHENEEDMLLEVFYSLKAENPHLKLVLVPRHLDGVGRAERFLQNANGSYALRTKLKPDLSDFTQDVLIGNTMGEIEFYLGLSDLIFMGGSLVDVGGHNPLEPAYFSLPIITGPYYYNFTEIYDTLIERGGTYVANDSRRLYSVCEMFLYNKELMSHTGMQAFEVQQEGCGSTNTNLKFLDESLR